MATSFSIGDITSALAFLLPGFVALSARSQFLTGIHHTQDSDRLLTYLTVSIIYNAAVFRFIDPALVSSSTMCFLVVFFVGPAAVGAFLGLNIQKNLVRGLLNRFKLFTSHALPTAWDWKFGNTEEQYVLVTLKNGGTVAGLMGSTSFAASRPEERDLYIQWIYDINDKEEWIPLDERGILIAANEISTIEFWPYDA